MLRTFALLLSLPCLLFIVNAPPSKASLLHDFVIQQRVTSKFTDSTGLFIKSGALPSAKVNASVSENLVFGPAGKHKNI